MKQTIAISVGVLKGRIIADYCTTGPLCLLNHVGNRRVLQQFYSPKLQINNIT